MKHQQVVAAILSIMATTGALAGDPPLTSIPVSGDTVVFPSNETGQPPTHASFTFHNPGPSARVVMCDHPDSPFGWQPINESFQVPPMGSRSVEFPFFAYTAGTFTAVLVCAAPDTQTFTFNLEGTTVLSEFVFTDGFEP